MNAIDLSTPLADTPAAALSADGAGEDAARRILVVDDNSDILELFGRILRGKGASKALDLLEASLWGEQTPAATARPRFLVDLASGGEDASTRALEARRSGNPYAVAFVDMRMPGGWDGLRTIDALWSVDSGIQIVICTAYSDHSWSEIIARLGRSDRLLILRKPFEMIEVFQIACALSDKWLLERQHEARLDELERRVAERTSHLEQALHDQRRAEQELQHHATHDFLTGLPNRALLMDRLQQRIAYAKRHGGRFVVCFLDLDHFKFINDSLGHGRGDELLKIASDRMRDCLRESDTVTRFGGDEFVLLLSTPDDAEDAMRVLDRLAASLSRPIKLGEQEVIVTCSMGCSTYPEDGGDSDALLKYADAAMYRAKELGRNRVQVYNDRLRVRIDERIKLESELRRALERDQLLLHYQPQVDLRTGRIIGVESLLRWKHPELGTVAPGRFIPIAEENGLIVPITEWVLRSACEQNKAWQEAGLPPVPVAVNLSMKRLSRLKLDALVAECLASSRLEPGFLELEVTETATMENPEDTILLLRALKSLGVRITIDDFGTGFSNLRYLRQFPVDKLKLDGSFVRDIADDASSLAIANAIIAMAHRLSLEVVAEMVETEEQVNLLASHGCDHVQGYYFSPAIPPDDCAALLRSATYGVPERPRSEAQMNADTRALKLGTDA